MQLTRWINSIPGNILCVLSKFSKSGDVWPTIPFYWVQETPWLVLCKSLLILGHLVVWPELWPKVSLPFWSVPFDRSRDEDFIVIFHEWTHLEHVYPYFFLFCLFVCFVVVFTMKPWRACQLPRSHYVFPSIFVASVLVLEWVTRDSEYQAFLLVT